MIRVRKSSKDCWKVTAYNVNYIYSAKTSMENDVIPLMKDDEK